MSVEQGNIGDSGYSSHRSPEPPTSMTLCCVHTEKRVHVHDNSHEEQRASAQRGLCRNYQKNVSCEEFDQEIFDSEKPPKRARVCQIDDKESKPIEIINADSEDVGGGILTTRTNRFHIPRNGIQSIHVMLFMDTDAPQPNFNGCAWAKILLSSYYLVMSLFHALQSMLPSNHNI